MSGLTHAHQAKSLFSAVPWCTSAELWLLGPENVKGDPPMGVSPFHMADVPQRIPLLPSKGGVSSNKGVPHSQTCPKVGWDTWQALQTSVEHGQLCHDILQQLIELWAESVSDAFRILTCM